MRLTTEQQEVLAAIQTGQHLKVHRTPDGLKRYRPYRVDGSVAGDERRHRRPAGAGRLHREQYEVPGRHLFCSPEKGNSAAATLRQAAKSCPGLRGAPANRSNNYHKFHNN